MTYSKKDTQKLTAHINEIIKILAVSDEKQVFKIQSFHDKIETHFRGLEEMAVDLDTYASIAFPVLLDKLPGPARLSTIRSTSTIRVNWGMTDLLEALKKGLEMCDTGKEKVGLLFGRSRRRELQEDRRQRST